jgi:hypothetical protein
MSELIIRQNDDPALAKIRVLREAANRIESAPDAYHWTSGDTCNCGIVMQVIKGIDAKALRKLRSGQDARGSWSYVSFCHNSGERYIEVIDCLMATGFDHADISNLEWLTDEKVLTRMDATCLDEQSAVDVVNYMRTWADLLQEQVNQPLMASGAIAVAVGT